MVDTEGTLVTVVAGAAVGGVTALGGTVAFAVVGAASFSFPFPFSFALAFPDSTGVAVPVPSPASVFRLLAAPPPAVPSGRRVRVAGVDGTD